MTTPNTACNGHSTIQEGFLIAGGTANVLAYEESTVHAEDDALVIAYDHVVVHAKGRSYVFASDNTTVYGHENANVRVSGDANFIPGPNYTGTFCRL